MTVGRQQHWSSIYNSFIGAMLSLVTSAGPSHQSSWDGRGWELGANNVAWKYHGIGARQVSRLLVLVLGGDIIILLHKINGGTPMLNVTAVLLCWQTVLGACVNLP